MRVVKKVLFGLLFILYQTLSGQDISGIWTTVDDETGKERSLVEMYEKEGRYFGKIKQIFVEPGEDPDPICVVCTDYRKDQKVIGMEIISNMKRKGDEYVGGEIMDPENGKSYKCKLWVEDGKLMVRGYLYLFYRTQTWLPYSE